MVPWTCRWHGWAAGVTLGQGAGMCPNPRVVGLLVDAGAGDGSGC